MIRRKRTRRSKDDGRFALRTLQNPTLEVRSQREILEDAERERQRTPQAAKNVAASACKSRGSGAGT